MKDIIILWKWLHRRFFCKHEYNIGITHGVRGTYGLAVHDKDGINIICYCPKCRTYFCEYNFNDY